MLYLCYDEKQEYNTNTTIVLWALTRPLFFFLHFPNLSQQAASDEPAQLLSDASFTNYTLFSFSVSA